jgi:hypothetical protein
MNKYGARRTFSELCGRTFASKAEAQRGEELRLLEMAGEISDLEYQPRFTLCEKPKITITLDFSYVEQRDLGVPGRGIEGHSSERIHEDVKGVLTRDFRTKLAWLKEKHGIDVRLINA